MADYGMGADAGAGYGQPGMAPPAPGGDVGPAQRSEEVSQIG